MLRWLPALALLLGCGGNDVISCTLADCSSGFYIVVREPPESGQLRLGDNPLPEGDYEIELFLDGTRRLCRGSLPSLEPFACDGAGVALDGLTGPLPGDAVGAFILTGEQTPRVESLVVRYQGSVLAEQRDPLTYQEFAPNGVACGPVCDRAAAELLLSF